jgi:uncharacterized membrane protein YphA (DoxX/SURF4 family)
MNLLTRLFLILLRLAIGWHFLFEGIEKIQSVDSATETNRAFTSSPYLQQSTGPLREFFQGQVGGDPDLVALDRLTLLPLNPGQDPATTPPHARLSPAVSAAWNDYLDRYAKHYQLDENQLAEARNKLDQAKDKAAKWLMEGTVEADRSLVTAGREGPAIKQKESVAARVREYRGLLERIEKMEKEFTAFEKDVRKKEYRDLKAEAAKMREALLAEQDKPMKEALETLQLTPDQKKIDPMKPKYRPPESFKEYKLIDWNDFVVRWGLVVVGGCLMLGLFTRTACLLAAAFLASLYLAMPALPWVPENVRTEGHYFFVNKNVIEMLALLVLATTHSGRWLGLDGLLHALNPFRRRTADVSSH